jgi:hypothetical protein
LTGPWWWAVTVLIVITTLVAGVVLARDLAGGAPSDTDPTETADVHSSVSL